jgi:hypothetical protein
MKKTKKVTKKAPMRVIAKSSIKDVLKTSGKPITVVDDQDDLIKQLIASQGPGDAFMMMGPGGIRMGTGPQPKAPEEVIEVLVTSIMQAEKFMEKYSMEEIIAAEAVAQHRIHKLKQNGKGKS